MPPRRHRRCRRCVDVATAAARGPPRPVSTFFYLARWTPDRPEQGYLLGESLIPIASKGALCTLSTLTTDPPNSHPNELAQILSGDPRGISLAREGLALLISLPNPTFPSSGWVRMHPRVALPQPNPCMNHHVLWHAPRERHSRSACKFP